MIITNFIFQLQFTRVNSFNQAYLPRTIFEQRHNVSQYHFESKHEQQVMMARKRIKQTTSNRTNASQEREQQLM